MTPIDVSFPSNHVKLAGHLYVPESYKQGERLPGIVVLHPGGGVKEQTAGAYAQKLANQGFVTLAFDRTSQGASEGTPRCVEDPFASLEDARSAVSFLATNKKVDPKRVGMLGICAGGGYAIAASSTDNRVKAVATVSMVDAGMLFTASFPKETLNAFIVQAGENRTEYSNGGEVKYLPFIPEITEDSPVLMKEAADYYLTPRAAHKNSVNKFALWSYDTLSAYDSFSKIERISPRPLLMIAGTNADTIEHTRIAYAKAGEPKEFHTIDGATHIDLYDRKVDEVSVMLTDFFKKQL